MIRPCMPLIDAGASRLSRALLKTDASCSRHDNVRLRGARAFIFKILQSYGIVLNHHNSLFGKMLRSRTQAVLAIGNLTLTPVEQRRRTPRSRSAAR